MGVFATIVFIVQSWAYGSLRLGKCRTQKMFALPVTSVRTKAGTTPNEASGEKTAQSTNTHKNTQSAKKLLLKDWRRNAGRCSKLLKEETMNLKDAILLLKQYQGYESFDNGVVLKHSFDLTDETVDTLLSALSVNPIGKPLTLWELEDMEGQKVLLYRMKSTEPLEPGTVKKYGDVLGDAGMLAYHELYLETWVAFSYQAQKKPDFDKPLTLEQLRGMDGECVKVVVDGVEPLEMLALVEVPKNEDCVLLRNNLGGVSEFYSDDDLREDGIKAYAYPPAHIDRGAWRCPICSGNEVIEFKAWKTPEQIINGPFAQGGAMFCPRCGKPRTPEAWAELEKRLRG